MINDLKKRGFALVTRAHLAHLSTSSYAEHMALGEFYEALDGKLDEILETFQGCYGKLDSPDNGVADSIAEFANWVQAHKKEIAKDNDIVENQLDELGSIFAKAHYKLTQLK